MRTEDSKIRSLRQEKSIIIAEYHFESANIKGVEKIWRSVWSNSTEHNPNAQWIQTEKAIPAAIESMPKRPKRTSIDKSNISSIPIDTFIYCRVIQRLRT